MSRRIRAESRRSPPACRVRSAAAHRRRSRPHDPRPSHRRRAPPAHSQKLPVARAPQLRWKHTRTSQAPGTRLALAVRTHWARANCPAVAREGWLRAPPWKTWVSVSTGGLKTPREVADPLGQRGPVRGGFFGFRASDLGNIADITMDPHAADPGAAQGTFPVNLQHAARHAAAQGNLKQCNDPAPPSALPCC